MSLRYQSNLIPIAAKFLQLSGVPATKTSLSRSLEEDPFYPSLYTLSKVFNRYGVENEAFEVEEDRFSDFIPPYIAYYNDESAGKTFVLVTSVTHSEVSYISEGEKPVTISRAKFLAGFQKVIFAAEANAESGEKDYAANVQAERAERRKKYARYAGLFLLIGLIYTQFYYSLSELVLAATLISITKLAGVVVTLLLLIYETDKSNSLVKNICTAGKQFNCDAVLNSKAGRVLGISWGEAGFVYFASTCLFLLLPGLAFTDKLPWLAIGSALVAPYILFSVYYQWRVVKQWCLLCLAVQSLLAAECIWGIFYYFGAARLTLPEPGFIFFITVAVAVLLPLLVWVSVRPLLQKAHSSTLYKPAYKRLLHHPDMIKSLLVQEDSVPDGWEHLGINLGNSEATDTILKICNPYCGPCSRAHAVLEEIVHNNKNVRVKVIFTATNNEEDRGAPVVRHLLALHEKNDPGKMENALDDWYLAEKKDYTRFSERYPMNGELTKQDEKIEMMSNWCKKAGIRYTPTIFVNGKRLPENYDAEVLKNLF